MEKGKAGSTKMTNISTCSRTSRPTDEADSPSREQPPIHRAEHVFGFIHRLRLGWLLAHLPTTVVWAIYVALNSFITIALLTFLALLTHSPFVFPSLGPTAYLFFFSPIAESASPRNAVLGHAIGLLCGFAAYKVTGMHAVSGRVRR